jgi:WD40 repeat protein
LALSCGSWDNTLRLWEVTRQRYHFSAPWAFCHVIYFQEIHESQSLISGEIEKAQEAFSTGDYPGAVKHLRQARSHKGYERSPAVMHLWQQLIIRQPRRSLADGWHLRTLTGHTSSVNSVCLSADGNLALSGSGDNMLRLWDTASGVCLRTFAGHTDGVYSVCMSTDGCLALSGSVDKTLRLWEVTSGKCLRTFKGHTDDVRSVCLSTDGKLSLSAGHDDILHLWDVESGACLRSFEEHSSAISVCLSADERFALTGSGDNMLRLWDTASGVCLRTFVGHTEGVYSVCMSTDGRLALSGSLDYTLRLWDIATGECLRTFMGHTFKVNSVCLSADNRFALSGSDDDTLRLWEVASGRCLRTLTGHTRSVRSVYLSADGRLALSGSRDHTLRLWALVWELEEKELADWDDGVRPYLQNFLILHTPYAGASPKDLQPTNSEIVLALTRRGKPAWNEDDFQQLLYTLGCAGYGWLRPEGVRRELEKMASEWQDPPLFGK